MTDIHIEKQKGSIVRVTCSGHTGYGERGEDVVCAGISTIVQTALLGLLNVAKINVDYVIYDATGAIEISTPELSASERHDADVILNTMLCGISDYYSEYSDYINLEVEELCL